MSVIGASGDPAAGGVKAVADVETVDREAVEATPDTAPTIGIDLGGTKIEGIVLTADGRTLVKRRIPSPREDYRATIEAIAGLVGWLKAEAASQLPGPARVGIAIPGSLAPATGRVQNANSTWLNGQPLQSDLTARLGTPPRLANDANCFALSEAEDGAAAGARSVFGVILGTGCGGGIVLGGRLIDGPRGIGGEWGHNPLPWPRDGETPGPLCWCGNSGCLETWISGPALAADHRRVTGADISVEDIVASARRKSDAPDVRAARSTLSRHASRLARGLASIVNVIDPEAIVLGGGLSNLPHLYAEVPELARPFIFAADRRIDLRPPRFGDASGARGAARLWRTHRER
ncbi:MAG: ROK family protein [Hyphomicrobiaceae bacterium]|nr:ROK family protein [Hyphomicrobiaceae bacterium]